MIAFTPLRHPRALGAVLTVVSLGAGTAALVAADVGGAPWVFVPLLGWILTLGLPTTLAVILTASVWGPPSPFHGLLPFTVAAAALAWVAQVAAVRGLNRLIR